MRKSIDSSSASSRSLPEASLLLVCASRQPGWEIELADWLHHQHHWLHRRCGVLLGNQAEAEDACQEVALKVMRAINRFEGRSSLRTWVARIADNHCYTVIRQRSAKAISTHLQYSIVLHETNRFSEEEALQATATSVEAVHSTLECLTLNNRQVLELRFFRELSLEQMASSLDLSLSATKMRLYRAMAAFRENHLATGINTL
jgi:RNA polymerase sigma-70 factor (ECF subfamily)